MSNGIQALELHEKLDKLKKLLVALDGKVDEILEWIAQRPSGRGPGLDASDANPPTESRQ